MNQDIKLKNEVEQLIEEVAKTHRYSMSRIYKLYNQVFGTTEQPQSCASCLIRKVKQLRIWLAAQPENKTGIEETKPRKRTKKTSND